MQSMASAVSSPAGPEARERTAPDVIILDYMGSVRTIYPVEKYGPLELKFLIRHRS